MATKTISLEIDAYDKLKRAKRSERESFSSAVRGARFPHESNTGKEVLEALRALRRSHPDRVLDEGRLNELAKRAGSRASRPRCTSGE